MKLGKKQEAAEILDRVVALEPTQANLLRVAELASELGNRKAAAAAFQRVAQLAGAEGGDAAQWYERAYQEDPSDHEHCAGLWQESAGARAGRGGDFYS